MLGKTAALRHVSSRPSVLPRFITLSSHVYSNERVEQAAKNIAPIRHAAAGCIAPNIKATPPRGFNNQIDLVAYHHTSSLCLLRRSRSEERHGRGNQRGNSKQEDTECMEPKTTEELVNYKQEDLEPDTTIQEDREYMDSKAIDDLGKSKQDYLKCFESKKTDELSNSKQEDEKCIELKTTDELTKCKQKYQICMKPSDTSSLFKAGILLPKEPSSSVPKEECIEVKKEQTMTLQDGITCPAPPRYIKAALLGCNGRVGQVLALLLKQCSLISELSLYDIYKIPQSMYSLTEIDTRSQINFCEGRMMLNRALGGADIVIFAAGVPRSSGLSKNELFSSNAEIVKELACACANKCPKALIAIITNPINSMVPVASEVLNQRCQYDPKRVFGVANTHVVRSSTIMGDYLIENPTYIYVPVVGGNTPCTMVPVLSQTKPCVRRFLDPVTEETLVCEIREAGINVVHLKEDTGSANLCTAYAAARFINCLAKGLNKEKNIVECAYVRSDIVKGCKYFITPLQLGPEGVVHNYGIPYLNRYESELLVEAIPKLQEEILTGEEFARPKKYESVLN